MFKLLIITFLLLSQVLLAQNRADSLRQGYGLFADYTLNFHHADFKRIYDCPGCSPGYRNGFGQGWAIGILYEHPINKVLSAEFRLSYLDFSGKLTRDEPIMLSVNNKAVEGMIEHTFDTKLNAIGLIPLIKYKPLKNFSINLGFHIGYLIDKSYSQKEEISSPKGFGTFIDSNGVDTKTRVRNEFSGELEKAVPVLFSPMIGFSYKVPMNKNGTLYAEPEIFYSYSLNNIVDDDLVSKWNLSAVRIGLSLKYTPDNTVKIIEKFEELYFIDTVQIETDLIDRDIIVKGIETYSTDIIEQKNVKLTRTSITRTDTSKVTIIHTLSCNVKAVGVDSSGNEIENPKFIIEEFTTRKLSPLLNYIFFDDNSSELPEKYVRLANHEVRYFSADSLFYNSTLDLYYNVLNIVGKRMHLNPFAKITLVGCNSDQGLEKGNKTLSYERAVAIKDYFTKTWLIDEYRIQITTRTLPEKASLPADDFDKMAENRRVEIHSDDYSIIEPIFLQNIVRTSNIPIARFKMEANSTAGVLEWNLNVSHISNQERHNIKVHSNQAVPRFYDIEINKHQQFMPKSDAPIFFRLSVSDKKGNHCLTPIFDIPVDITTIREKRELTIDDYEIEVYNLILFDFDDYKISKENLKIIEFVKSRMRQQSEVEIRGYTDRLGEDEYNKILSGKRANQTKSLIERPEALTEGLGETILLYDNDVPEGRFYSRTVEIKLKTKVK
jgi:outer membrane protein OmpA-like peptidoglycan-associated protein